MKNLILLIALATTSSAFANETCKDKLANLALAAFEASDSRVEHFDLATEVNMNPKIKEVTIYQYKAQYSVSFQLQNEDEEACIVEQMSDIVEIL